MSLSSVQIRPDLFLVCQKFSKDKPATKAAKKALNHIWLYDRSGSMYGLLSSLVEDLKKQARTLKTGDTLTVGWFSSERGEFNFIVKGFKIAGEDDFKNLDKMFDKNSTTIGCTCFSEILAASKQVIDDLKVFSDTFSLCFFTDGYPCVSNYNKEIENIFSAIKSISGEIASSLLVGYGYYYNKQLMTDMAERLGGSLTHSSSIAEFQTSMDMFLGDAKCANKKVQVTLEVPSDNTWQTAFTVTGNSINLLEQQKGGVVSYTPSEETNDYVYTLTSKKPSGAVAVTFSEKDIRKQGQNEFIVRGLYAAAYVLTQKAKTDVAMEALATLGEVHLIDKLTNAYTPSEYGNAEKALAVAIQDTKHRLEAGYQPSYLPKPDAFCLIDALDVLLADKDAYFYPYHDAFEYGRIGVKATAVSDAPKFHAEKDVKVPLSTLTWNSKMLNLSVLARIQGTIGLTGEYKKFGFSPEYPTNVFRNYTLVKDGFLNVKEIPVSMSKESFAELKKNGVIGKTERWVEDKIYVLHLDRVPVINRAMAEGKTSAAALADNVIEELQYKGKLKALRYFKEQELGEETQKVGVFASLSDDQVAYLEKHYITKNGFSPKVEKEEATDYYHAKEFEVKVKGLSSFPKVEDVIDKLDNGKKLTVSDSYVAEGIKAYRSSPVAKQASTVKLAWLEDAIRNDEKEMRKIGRNIQETKFAVLLAKKWFDEFQTRDENTLDRHGNAVTFALREVKVNL